MLPENFKCLMIEVNGNRFFTHLKNRSLLIEFANVFNATLTVVRLKSGSVLNMTPLAKAISDNTTMNGEFEAISSQKPEPKVVEVVEVPSEKPKNRKVMMENAVEIRGFIRQEFMGTTGRGGVLRTQSIADKFKEMDLSPSCLSNHLKFVKTEMEKEGWIFDRVKRGMYTAKLRVKAADYLLDYGGGNASWFYNSWGSVNDDESGF